MAPKHAFITGETKLAGVIGWPITHTLSPVMQNIAFMYYNLAVTYVPLGVPPQGLKMLLMSLQQLGADGVNVTIHYKEKVMSFLDQLAPSAKAIQAVNTIVFQSGKMVGHNTDGFGFLASLKGVQTLHQKQAVLLGGGGAGRAVAISLAQANVRKITIVDIDEKRLRKLVREVKALGCSHVAGMRPGTEALKQCLQQTDLLVNATPLGLKAGDPLPIPQDWMPKRKCVMDLVYGRRPTSFFTGAARKQNRVVPGWKMLLLQGAESFRLWTGKKPPVAKMEAALLLAAGIKK